MRLGRGLRYAGAAIVAVVAVLSAVIVGRFLQRRQTARQTKHLRRTATTGRRREFTADDIRGLPEPVQDYLETVLQEGQQYVETVSLEQEGELRIGDADSAWKPFTATQSVTTTPPGFCWDASVRLWPLIEVSVRDVYCDGDGNANVSVFGLIPLGGDDANPELNEGELLRYLAEAVWYPTALLPSEGVEWGAVDESTATATLEYGGTSATPTFHFTEDDEVAKVHAEQRPRRVGDGYEPTPWIGRWHDYETRDGMRIPTEGEVIWHLPDGDVNTWRGRVTGINYDEWEPGGFAAGRNRIQ